MTTIAEIIILTIVDCTAAAVLRQEKQGESGCDRALYLRAVSG